MSKALSLALILAGMGLRAASDAAIQMADLITNV